MLLPTPTMSVGVGRMFESICLFVCLSVCPEHNSKTNDPKVFKLGIGNDFGSPRSDNVLEFKGQDHRVTNSFRIPCILEPRFIDIHYVSLPVVCGFADA